MLTATFAQISHPLPINDHCRVFTVSKSDSSMFRKMYSWYKITDVSMLLLEMGNPLAGITVCHDIG